VTLLYIFRHTVLSRMVVHALPGLDLEASDELDDISTAMLTKTDISSSCRMLMKKEQNGGERWTLIDVELVIGE
jgi:hypothetical protein